MKPRAGKTSKRSACRKQIESMISRNGLWGKRLPPEREMAGGLNVARRTLQEVLSDLEADGLVERRHGVGTFARHAAQPGGAAAATNLAIIAGSHYEREPGWHYRGQMICGALAYAARIRARCQVLALDAPEERERVFDAAAMRGFAGFISVAEADSALITHLLALRRGPVVLLDDLLPDVPVIGVVDGSFAGAQQIARHLLARGHRRVAFVDTQRREVVNPRKFEGYRSIMVRRGLFDEQLVVTPESLGMFAPEMEQVYSVENPGTVFTKFVGAAVDRLLALAEPPTAIFCFDDKRAVPALAALEARGLRPGTDVAVAGFGDTAIRTGKSDRLTSCRIYPRKMGRIAVRAASGSVIPGEARAMIVPNRVYVRQSTLAPARAAGPSAR